MQKLLITLLISTLSIQFSCASELVEDYFDIATDYAVAGDYESASEWLTKILEIEPDNYAATEQSNGLYYIMTGKTGSYITGENAAVRKAVKAKVTGASKEEMNALSVSIAASVSDYWSAFFLGEYYRERGDYENARLYYNKALAMKPKLTQCYLSIAVCDFKLKQYDKAEYAVKKYIELNPNEDMGYFELAKIQLAQNCLEDAEKNIRKALSINDDVTYNFLFGRILYAKGNYQGASYIFNNLKKETKLAEVFAYAGFTDDKLGNKASALDNLERAIILSDDDKSLKEKYNEIKNRTKTPDSVPQ